MADIGRADHDGMVEQAQHPRSEGRPVERRHPDPDGPVAEPLDHPAGTEFGLDRRRPDGVDLDDCFDVPVGAVADQNMTPKLMP